MKILITGGAGFIGSNFIRILLNENLCDSVLNVDRQTYAGNPENLIEFEKDSRYQFLKADIGDTRKVESAISEFCPSSIINFAAESHVDRSIDSPEPFVETNVLWREARHRFKIRHHCRGGDGRPQCLNPDTAAGLFAPDVRGIWPRGRKQCGCVCE